MAVKHFKKYGGGCFCGDITPAAAPLTKDDRWTEDPGDAKASKRCRKERARAIRSVAMHATAGQPISPAVAERLWQPGDDVPQLRARVLKHVSQEVQP